MDDLVARVQAALRRQGVLTQVRLLEQSTHTAQEAAAALHTELGSIVKSLVFLVDGRPILVLVSGDKQVDDRKLAALLGVGRKKVEIADPATVLAATGYPVGGVPPVGHLRQLPCFIDRNLARYATVYAAAGTEYAIFPLSWEALRQATGGEVVDMTKE